MDYTEGAISIPRDAMIAATIDKLGEPEAGNSQFTKENLFDTFHDRRVYVLRHELMVAFIEEQTEATEWVSEVQDCDSRTIIFGRDCIKAAYGFGWKHGLAAYKISYDSASLGDQSSKRKRLAGYHATPLVWSHRNGIELTPWIIQPKPLYTSGNEGEARIQDHESEIRFWVCMEQIT